VVLYPSVGERKVKLLEPYATVTVVETEAKAGAKHQNHSGQNQGRAANETNAKLDFHVLDRATFRNSERRIDSQTAERQTKRRLRLMD